MESGVDSLISMVEDALGSWEQSAFGARSKSAGERREGWAYVSSGLLHGIKGANARVQGGQGGRHQRQLRRAGQDGVLCLGAGGECEGGQKG